jgi:formylglycine-generating enzyme required for sulfatase activity
VVHIAWADALAYCAWSGLRLPTAWEWEVAALAQFLLSADSAWGLVDNDYCWGNELNPNGQWMANTWQGLFPWENLTADGWFWTSPVGHYPAKGYGLVDMAGNVWDWTSTPFPIAAGVKAPQIVKGGSFLCADNYCMRYLSSAFIAQTLDTATCHMGFRCAADTLV